VTNSNIALSGDQLEPLSASKDRFIEKAQALVLELLTNRRKIRNLLTLSDIDKPEVKKLQQGINNQESKIANLLTDHLRKKVSDTATQQQNTSQSGQASNSDNSLPIDGNISPLNSVTPFQALPLR
jgi:tRNA G18 (ribose-2'-O)-methylase SpoU